VGSFRAVKSIQKEPKLWQRPTGGLQCNLKAGIIAITDGQSKFEKIITDTIDRQMKGITAVVTHQAQNL
jgi:hypothetical protein